MAERRSEGVMFRVGFAFVAAIIAVGLPADDVAAQALDGRLKTIIDTKKIKIAHRVDSTPFSFLNEHRQPTGYTIDICKSVVASLERQFKVTGIEIQWVPVTSQSRFDVVAKGEADIECGASTVTLGRMKEVDFSNYIFVESTGVAVLAKSGINNANDLAGKKVAVVEGTSNEQAIVRKSKQGAIDVVRVKERAQGIAALESGKVDGYASDKLLLVGAKFSNPSAMKLLPDDLSVEPYAIVLPRGDWALRLAVNTALAQIMGGTEMAFIFNSWFGRLGFQPGVLMSATFILNALAE
jgi:glutamate/aspartate transport system substrate-binding protein